MIQVDVYQNLIVHIRFNLQMEMYLEFFSLIK